MKAKNTVMTWKQTVECSHNPTLELRIEAIKEAQAEISFKAGYEKCAEELEVYLLKWKRAGAKEVVEWIPELIVKIKDAMWKDDWGVKGVLYEDMLDSLVRKLVKTKLKEWGIK